MVVWWFDDLFGQSPKQWKKTRYPLAFLALGAVLGDVKRDTEIEASLGLVVEHNVRAHGLACCAMTWKFTQGMIPIQPVCSLGLKTDYRSQSLLGPHQAGPWPPCPCIGISFISVNKELFHSLVDGSLNRRIIPHSCQLALLIFSFSPSTKKVQMESGWVGGGMPEKKLN